MATYSPKQYELFLAIESGNMGTAETTATNFVKLEVENVSDIDFSNIIQERTPRSGQQIMRPTDRYHSQKGSSYTFSFEWVVNHKEGLQKLLQLISEDAGAETPPAFSVAGTFAPSVYNHGASTGKRATLIVSNPNTGDDRLMTSAVLTELSLSMDSGTAGGRLVASGTFYSGYLPTLGSNSVSPTGTQTSWTYGIYDCTTKTVGGSAVVLKSMNLNISFPAQRVGYQGSNAEVQEYSRSDEYTASGEVVAKYDSATSGAISHFFSGAEKVIAIGDGGTNIDFSLPQVVYTGFSKDMNASEGVFVSIPFDCGAEGSESLYTITVG